MGSEFFYDRVITFEDDILGVHDRIRNFAGCGNLDFSGRDRFIRKLCAAIITNRMVYRGSPAPRAGDRSAGWRGCNVGNDLILSTKLINMLNMVNGIDEPFFIRFAKRARFSGAGGQRRADGAPVPGVDGVEGALQSAGGGA